MCSLTDFIEMSLGRCGGLVSTATVTGPGASLVDTSVRGGDFSWPKSGTSRGHQRGHQLAKNGDFLMATDNVRLLGFGSWTRKCPPPGHPLPVGRGHQERRDKVSEAVCSTTR